VIIEGAARAVRRLNEAGLTVAVVTNQSGIGKGRYTAAGLDAVHARLVAELARDGARLDGLYHCPHLAEDLCDCRKPLPGLLQRAAADLGFDPARAVLVGDTARDLQAAAAVGAAQVLVRTGKGADLESRLPVDEARPEVVSTTWSRRWIGSWGNEPSAMGIAGHRVLACRTIRSGPEMVRQASTLVWLSQPFDRMAAAHMNARMDCGSHMVYGAILRAALARRSRCPLPMAHCPHPDVHRPHACRA
jgi:D-glycero-D-manno-heptose 1,7-bisphosphate phosphatase